MGTGIYKFPFGEVSQDKIDWWCERCKYPTEIPRCTTKAAIQQCWRLPDAHTWHLLHECPMAHGGEPCRCNELAELKKQTAT